MEGGADASDLCATWVEVSTLSHNLSPGLKSRVRPFLAPPSRGQPWSLCAVHCGCLMPAPTGCRANAGRQCLQSLAPLWTSSC